MNRRDFTRSLVALGLTAAIPSLALAAPQPALDMYGRSVHMARNTGLCSIKMLSQKLALPATAARDIQAKLIRNGVITTPDKTGIAMAIRPYAAAIRFKI